jgi:hypothetical protein
MFGAREIAGGRMMYQASILYIAMGLDPTTYEYRADG